MQEAASLLIAEGFQITAQSEATGVIQGKTNEEFDIRTGIHSYFTWTIQVKRNKIIGTCVENKTSKNAFGSTITTSEVYYNDSKPESVGIYWNVRDGLETICNSKITIINFKKGENKSGRKKTSGSNTYEKLSE